MADTYGDDTTVLYYMVLRLACYFNTELRGVFLILAITRAWR